MADHDIEDHIDPFLLMSKAVRTLSGQLVFWVVLAMSFGLFGYAAVKHEPWSFASACSFTVLALALMWRERKR